MKKLFKTLQLVFVAVILTAATGACTGGKNNCPTCGNETPTPTPAKTPVPEVFTTIEAYNVQPGTKKNGVPLEYHLIAPGPDGVYEVPRNSSIDFEIVVNDPRLKDGCTFTATLTGDRNILRDAGAPLSVSLPISPEVRWDPSGRVYIVNGSNYPTAPSGEYTIRTIGMVYSCGPNPEDKTVIPDVSVVLRVK